VPREWSGTRAKETVSGNSGPIGSILADLGDVCWSSNSGGRADVAGYLKRAIAPDAQTLLQQVYLQGDGHQLDHWILTANQAGVCALKIFEKVHAKRFSDLGVGPKIDALAAGL
jgi:hypothetical protein